MNVLILAGERQGGDPLAIAEQVANKTEIHIAGKPMITYVLDAVRGLKATASIYLVSSQEQPAEGVTHIIPADSPCASVLRAINGLTFPLLLTTADHPLLTSEMIEDFLASCEMRREDLCVGVVPLAIVKAHYPENRRTKLRFKEGGYSGANLFYLRNDSVVNILEFWQKVERERKRPLRMMWLLGTKSVLQYLLGLLTLEDVIARISKRTGTTIAPILIHDPHAAIDVDKPSDLALVRSILTRRNAR